MTALTSILLAVLAQAAAPPAGDGCFPPCRSGYVCSPAQQCVAEAPPPASYQQPQPAGYPQPQPAGYPQPSAQQPSAPPPGYAYPPAAAPAYQQPAGGYPAASGYAPQVAAPRQAPYRQGPRFGFFLGGLVLPGTDVTAAAGGAIVTFGSQRIGFESRVYGALAHVEDEYTKTTAGVAVAHGTYWWGAYGLGFGGGLGYADFSRKASGGWDDSSAMVLAYAAPVMLRFGRQPTFELGLNAGATRFFSHDVRPYGYLYGGLLF